LTIKEEEELFEVLPAEIVIVIGGDSRQREGLDAGLLLNHFIGYPSFFDGALALNQSLQVYYEHIPLPTAFNDNIVSPKDKEYQHEIKNIITRLDKSITRSYN